MDDPQAATACYVFTPLDAAVRDRAVEGWAGLNKNLPVTLMRYWDKYKAEMTKIFEISFPEARTQRWINRDVFKHDMLVNMADTLFDWLCDVEIRKESRSEFLTVDFSHALGIPLYACQMDPNVLFRAANLKSIYMVVNTNIMYGVSS